MLTFDEWWEASDLEYAEEFKETARAAWSYVVGQVSEWAIVEAKKRLEAEHGSSLTIIPTGTLKALREEARRPLRLQRDALLKACEAGQEAGGDKRGRMSAALLIASQQQTENHPIIDLRVDEHHDPVKELKRMFEKKWL